MCVCVTCVFLSFRWHLTLYSVLTSLYCDARIYSESQELCTRCEIDVTSENGGYKVDISDCLEVPGKTGLLPGW